MSCIEQPGASCCGLCHVLTLITRYQFSAIIRQLLWMMSSMNENQLATPGDDDSIIRQIDPYTIRLYNKPGDVGIINLCTAT
jgi:hypothetical protein